MQRSAVKQSVNNLLISWRTQMQNRPRMTLAWASVIGAMLFMLIANLITAFNQVEPVFLQWALIGGAVGAASTAIGAAPGFFYKKSAS